MTSFVSWFSVVMLPVLTMHGIAFGWIVPCVVHVAWLIAGCGTTVKLKRERSPSGILNDTDAEAFAVSVGDVSISTTAEPTNPHPRPELVAPLPVSYTHLTLPTSDLV